MRIQYAKFKCDCCGKEVEEKESYHMPLNWIEVLVTQWYGNCGTGIFNVDVCSKKCAVKMMKAVEARKLKKPKPAMII